VVTRRPRTGPGVVQSGGLGVAATASLALMTTIRDLQSINGIAAGLRNTG